MHEAGVEIRPAGTWWIGIVDMPEWIDPVGVIDVRVDSEDLAEDGLAVREEVLGKSGGFADPVVARELRKRGGEGGWSCRDG